MALAASVGLKGCAVIEVASDHGHMVIGMGRWANELGSGAASVGRPSSSPFRLSLSKPWGETATQPFDLP